MQVVVPCAFEVAPLHPVVHSQVPDHRLGGWSAFDVFLLSIHQTFEFASVLDVQTWIDCAVCLAQAQHEKKAHKNPGYNLT